jgi:hypothetical protein
MLYYVGDYRTLLTPVEEEDAEGKRSITWQVKSPDATKCGCAPE